MNLITTLQTMTTDRKVEGRKVTNRVGSLEADGQTTITYTKATRTVKALCKDQEQASAIILVKAFATVDMEQQAARLGANVVTARAAAAMAATNIATLAAALGQHGWPTDLAGLRDKAIAVVEAAGKAKDLSAHRALGIAYAQTLKAAEATDLATTQAVIDRSPAVLAAAKAEQDAKDAAKAAKDAAKLAKAEAAAALAKAQAKVTKPAPAAAPRSIAAMGWSKPISYSIAG